MGLVDLLTDLENFKYGMSSPDKVDGQIESGVDFFDDLEGGAVGFTTQAEGNLLSQYNKFIEGTVGPIGGEVDPYANLNSIEGRETTYENWGHGVRPNLQTKPPRGNLHYDGENYISIGILGQTTFWGIPDFSIINQPAATAYNSPFQPLPPYDFMVTPIANFVSRYPTDPSVTWGVHEGTMTGPAAAWPDPDTLVPISHMLRRGVYNEYPVLSFVNVGSSINGASIHISPTGEINAGTRYGAMTLLDFINYEAGSTLIDVVRQTVPLPYADLLPLTGRTSQFSTDGEMYDFEGSATQTTFNLPIETSTGFISDFGSADYTRPTGFYKFTDQKGFPPDILGVLDSVAKQIEINKKIEFEDGQFTEVPSGLNENNLFGTKTFREVADPHNIASFRQPFILRPIPTEGDGTPGNGRWGFDPIPADSGLGGFLGGAASEFIGGFFRGAPTFTGLVERNVADKIRIGKFLLTPAGIGFLGKQFALQALNPTMETKVYNPLSALNIPLGVITDPEGAVRAGGISGLATLIASFALPIAHTERHLGGARYENLILGTGGSRLINQVKAFSIEIPDIPVPSFNTGFSYFDNWANKNVNNLVEKLDAGLVTPMFGLSNPNKYAFPISSAPKSVKDGDISFIGSADLAQTDVQTAMSKVGGNFNEQTSTSEGSHGHTNVDATILDKYSTLSYGQLQKAKAYMTGSRAESQENKKVGNPAHPTEVFDDSRLGKIKKDKSYVTENVDRINMTPYGVSTMMDVDGVTSNKDFIKFKFEDMVNNKWIVFRAILEGISDSISPEYGEERYIGRPDKVYVYQGADRNISFGFSIYPKTKQELPVLMEKLNYLVGLCYPSYTEGERMKTPFISLTLGDMFNRAPGVLSSLSITVEDNSTWEIDDGLQFPHYIKAQCEFKYIGNNVLASKGRHYGIKWLPDGSGPNRWSTANLGFNDSPFRDKIKIAGRSAEMSKLFFDLGQKQ